MRIVRSGSGSFKSLSLKHSLRYPCGFTLPHKQRRARVFSLRCVWSPSQHTAAFYLAYQDKSAGGKNPVYVKLRISAALPFAVAHDVSFVVQQSWKIAVLTGGVRKQEAVQEMQETLSNGTKAGTNLRGCSSAFPTLFPAVSRAGNANQPDPSLLSVGFSSCFNSGVGCLTLQRGVRSPYTVCNECFTCIH